MEASVGSPTVAIIGVENEGQDVKGISGKSLALAHPAPAVRMPNWKWKKKS